MRDGASALESFDLLPAEGETEAASVLRIALLLIAQHGAMASEAARTHAETEDDPLAGQLWRWIIAAVENLLEALAPTDLLYATALAAPAGARIAARAA